MIEEKLKELEDLSKKYDQEYEEDIKKLNKEFNEKFYNILVDIAEEDDEEEDDEEEIDSYLEGAANELLNNDSEPSFRYEEITGEEFWEDYNKQKDYFVFARIYYFCKDAEKILEKIGKIGKYTFGEGSRSNISQSCYFMFYSENEEDGVYKIRCSDHHNRNVMADFNFVSDGDLEAADIFEVLKDFILENK